MKRIRITALLTASMAVSAMQAQQADTTGYGGPDGLDIYDELLPEATPEEARVEIRSAARALGMLCDVADSLALIPGYDLYCHWNTEAIFDRENTAPFTHDTLCLDLSVTGDDFAMPCLGHLTSPFGPRRGRMHYGLDLKLRTGDPVVCAFPGVVRISRYNRSFGHVVVVRHHNGLETLYAHLSKRKVEPGHIVEAGDTLGLGGNTGRSHGSHLHFEVRFLDQPIDPSLIVDVENGQLKARTFEINKGTFASIAAAKATAGSRKYHAVRNGDTLSAVARRYGTSVPVLCKLNGISQRSVLRIGQRLRYN
jgi:murein DD-endopeptidase MepM/ murein hydrolase activator NlpD